MLSNYRWINPFEPLGVFAPFAIQDFDREGRSEPQSAQRKPCPVFGERYPWNTRKEQS